MPSANWLKRIKRYLPTPILKVARGAKLKSVGVFYNLTGHVPQWLKYADPQAYWEGRSLLAEDRATGAHSGKLTTAGRAFFLDELAREPFQSILDAGCGYAREMKPVCEKFRQAHVVGVDISFNMLRDAREYFPEATGWLVQASLTALPFPNKVFDAAFSTAVLQHIPVNDAKQAMREMARVTNSRILHREIYRKHIAMAGRKDLLERFDLAGHIFPNDYETAYKQMGHAIFRSEVLPPYQAQQRGPTEEMWYSFVVVRLKKP